MALSALSSSLSLSAVSSYNAVSPSSGAGSSYVDTAASAGNAANNSPDPQPSNPANVASAPVPADSTPPIYSAVGNANASIIRGSGVDILA